MSVLGVIKGFSGLPAEMRNGITAIGDSTFINTNYTYNKAVESTYAYAMKFIKNEGGEATDKELKIKTQVPEAPPLEVSFPNLVLDHRVSIFEGPAWKHKGNWQTFTTKPYGQDALKQQSRYAEKAGDELNFTFSGSGITLMGNWVRDGGKAEVYLDGKLHRTIDSYFYWNKQEHYDMNLWHAFGLQPGNHNIRLVVKGEKRPESMGTKLYITEALVFRTAPKKDEGFKFSFER